MKNIFELRFVNLSGLEVRTVGLRRAFAGDLGR